jgi:diguanylate cyclase (GGDEF)-like protein/PAS domain S-box-containing protein
MRALSSTEFTMAVALGSVTNTKPDLSNDIAVLQRKWKAALPAGRRLPPFEEIILGSLGRLADYIALISDDGTTPQVLRGGEYFSTWIGRSVQNVPVADLPPDCAAAIRKSMSYAHAMSAPYLSVAHCVRDGQVRTYDVMALPLDNRWGATLTALYVRERGVPYNLIDAIFQSTNDGMLALAAIRDASGMPVDFQIVDLNRGASLLLRQPAEELRWRQLSEGSHALCSVEMREQLVGALNANERRQFEVEIDADHGTTHLRISAAAIGDLVAVALTDVTGLKQREQSFRLLFDNNPMPMFVVDVNEARLVSVNDAAIKHYGYTKERLLSFRFTDLWSQRDREAHANELSRIDRVCDSRQSWHHVCADGSAIEVLLFGRRMRLNGRDAQLVAVVDITERRRTEAQIAYMAHHDALTGLPNRNLFHDRVEQLIAQHIKSTCPPAAVMCLDLDMFKNVNDTFGHPMGDDLLKAVAVRLTDSLRPGDFVARIGGDEFAVVLGAISGADDAGDIAERLIETLSAPYEINGVELIVSASVGLTLVPQDGENADELLRNADMALYRAKSDGRRLHRFFEREMENRVQRRREMEVDLRQALANGDLELRYQPLINASSLTVTGFEALLRWRHPEKGPISPSEFIPIAEETGLIVALGEWVLREACSEAKKWPEHISVAVNLSPVQFRSPNLVSAVLTTLARTGLASHRLELEITESVLLADSDANLSTLRRLRGLGVRISLDDFGTGSSSLSYLRSFPFDKIKIDRSFVRELHQRPDCAAIVRAIAGIGRSLDVPTTAEGVETAEQLDRIRQEGCTEVQGHFFSAAQPASELQKVIARFSGKAVAAA